MRINYDLLGKSVIVADEDEIIEATITGAMINIDNGTEILYKCFYGVNELGYDCYDWLLEEEFIVVQKLN